MFNGYGVCMRRCVGVPVQPVPWSMVACKLAGRQKEGDGWEVSSGFAQKESEKGSRPVGGNMQYCLQAAWASARRAPSMVPVPLCSFVFRSMTPQSVARMDIG